MMSISIYQMTFEFHSTRTGETAMWLELGVNTFNGSLHGSAHGPVNQGGQHPLKFTTLVTGHLFEFDSDDASKVGVISGQALVECSTETGACELTPFTASFVLDENWSGSGRFALGNNEFDCNVANVSIHKAKRA